MKIAFGESGRGAKGRARAANSPRLTFMLSNPVRDPPVATGREMSDGRASLASSANGGAAAAAP